ncbi:MAG: Uma2 family endonuclease [Actinomycetota bacterium]|nr:Uma2 family endonuclease [Actinomycetota bacterium]
MQTFVLDPDTSGFNELLERRRRAGADRFDEVWEGVLHMAPAPRGEHADLSQQLAELLGVVARTAGLFTTMSEFNLGESEFDYRIPDGGIHRQRLRGVWHATAALVVEIVSPGDESWEKLPYYAAHHVEEVLIVDPQERQLHWLALEAGEYRPVERSGLMELAPAELAARIDWP